MKSVLETAFGAPAQTNRYGDRIAHFISNDRPTNLVELRVGARGDVQLWGGDPRGERLEVAPADASVIRVDEIPVSLRRDLRGFSPCGLRRGSTRLYARLGRGGVLWADTQIVVGRGSLNRYYHGTSSSIADVLADVDLTPMVLASLSVASVARLDWTDYTDFGKGFYVHLEANKAMAYEWARRRFASDWAVVEFVATTDEHGVGQIAGLLATSGLARGDDLTVPVLLAAGALVLGAGLFEISRRVERLA